MPSPLGSGPIPLLPWFGFLCVHGFGQPFQPRLVLPSDNQRLEGDGVGADRRKKTSDPVLNP